jgi:transposase
MTPELWREIHALHDTGLKIRAISRRLKIHRRTVREALRATQVPKPASRRRSSIIDAHRGWLLAKLQQYPQLTAARLFHMLQEQGFTGSYSTVKQCVAELRPRVKPVYLSLHFEPGECAQVDWGVWKGIDVAGGRRRISFFTMVLCHSRMLYAQLSLGEATEHWLAAHRNAFEFFNGVPMKVMVDNCKTAVITPKTADQPACINTAYQQFADHYGFKIVPCTPNRPNEKGRVENAVGYVKSSFLAGREPAAIEALAPALAHWLEHTANVRIHGTTKKRPVDVFTAEEQPALHPLPGAPHGCQNLLMCVANSRCRVVVDTNRYSVGPKFGSRRLVLHKGAEHIRLFSTDGVFVADHPRCYGRNQAVISPEHERLLHEQTQHTRDKRAIEAFLTLGTAAEKYLAGLREKRPDYRSQVRKINALVDIHGRDEVARVIMDALEYQAFSSDYLVTILDARKRPDTEPGPLHVTRREDLLDIDIPQPDLDIYEAQNPHNPEDDQ